ncbi:MULTISPECIES: TetR/AcrR family transcriptional regulator [Sphingobacterium]|jgi:AcrR family transcriptional regulator|uniref:TetR/AcrR family transcriptional regulator n=2 Tax=Sphingobacterium TaxID=28453 RepID=A0ABW5YRD6_9SPHI|nr:MULTISPECIES: TetR/AcrR family transcriptional regulator [Sphingobacterium]MBB2953149.1 AcrR family transcriptional regulator [Sphingobacterium sp. JUb56]MCS3555252.1 AcrR family transcriptional regulator [Sphingobacterium sp. JUb21]MCW2261593.1 AcrR family transcriptional regulator [Sphingobacterium kitahiroshimense]NJI75335.1 TetR/AcrR family transcriptional regulator [Sphingobacterium sp. B16(2022)]QQD14956.1 TetR/AcrR family transcriptional regulator [Sphingobacterium sp. UDSM-2020]
MEADKIIESIKRSARELFRKYGYNKTSVNELAKRANIAKATFYKYFDSKELILHAILMEYIQENVKDILKKNVGEEDLAVFLGNTILKVSRLTYTVCNEFVGWEFIRESANAQEYLKTLSDDLEFLLLSSFIQNDTIAASISEKKLTFLIKTSKNIVFSFAFTAVTEADVRKNFISFQKEILPYLVHATIH